MGEISLPVLFNFIIFLAFPFIGGYLAIRFRLPTIIGYIIGGLVLGIFLGEKLSGDFLSHFAGLGLVLLLFTVGLEMNLGNFRRFGRFVLIGGLLQIIFSALFIGIASLLFRFNFVESIFIGFACAMSSTAIVAKLIQQQGEENSLYGAISIGILVFQDLASIPIIIIASSLNGGNGFEWHAIVTLLLGVLKAGGILILIYFFGKKLTPIIFGSLASLSQEILNLFSILFIFIIVYLFTYIGLSSAIAAFISGVLIGTTMEHHHIFSQIRPLRDLFAILFFVFLGASVKLDTVLYLLPAILLFSLVLIVIKLCVVTVLCMLLRLHSRTSFSIGITLSQAGEFSFIILTLGLGSQLLSSQSYYFVLLSVLISIVITPFLFSSKDILYKKIRQFIKKHFPPLFSYISQILDREPPNIEAIMMKDHIILCGFGRVGSYIGRALILSKIPFIAIDNNFYAVQKAKSKGVTIIYGDPTNMEILDYAECEHALCIVSVIPDKNSQETIILNAKRLNPNIAIFARVSRQSDQERLKDMGATTVIQPEFEAALAIIKKILIARDIPREEIIGRVKRLKIEHGML